MRDDAFVDFVIDQLHRIKGVRRRRMFGAYGLYCGEIFFAIVDEGRLYFKTDDTTSGRYKQHGMAPFHPSPEVQLKKYFEVPVDILEDDEQLAEWAREAVDVGNRASAGRPKRGSQPKRRRD
jgi:DNA transformation protein